MAKIFEQESRTFSEYLLVPNLTTEENTPDKVDLSAPVAKYKKGQEESRLKINIPMVSAVMQSVSDDGMAIALARCGGLSFVFQSQSIESQCDMIRKVKKYKAGIVESDSNLSPDDTLEKVLELHQQTGHGTAAVTEDGSKTGKLLGLVTTRDYRVSRMSLDTKVREFMTPIDKLVTAPEGTSLKEANDIIWDNKINQLPIVDKEGRLVGLVFRKDYDFHKANPNELLDAEKKLIVGAGINTRDYAERVPALIEAGADVLCLDSSDGFSVWQERALKWCKENYPDAIVGAGNVVDAEGFRFLADCGAAAQTSSRSVSAAVPSASHVSRRVSAAARLPLFSLLQKSVTSTSRKQAFTSLFAPTAVSYTTITWLLHLPWALTSSCSEDISQGSTNPLRESSSLTALMLRSTGEKVPTVHATGSVTTTAERAARWLSRKALTPMSLMPDPSRTALRPPLQRLRRQCAHADLLPSKSSRTRLVS